MSAANPYRLSPSQRARLVAVVDRLERMARRGGVELTDVWLSRLGGLDGVFANALESRGLIRDRRRRGRDFGPDEERLARRDYARLNDAAIAEGRRLRELAAQVTS